MTGLARCGWSYPPEVRGVRAEATAVSVVGSDLVSAMFRAPVVVGREVHFLLSEPCLLDWVDVPLRGGGHAYVRPVTGATVDWPVVPMVIAAAVLAHAWPRPVVHLARAVVTSEVSRHVGWTTARQQAVSTVVSDAVDCLCSVLPPVWPIETPDPQALAAVILHALVDAPDAVRRDAVDAIMVLVGDDAIACDLGREVDTGESLRMEVEWTGAVSDGQLDASTHAADLRVTTRADWLDRVPGGLWTRPGCVAEDLHTRGVARAYQADWDDARSVHAAAGGRCGDYVTDGAATHVVTCRADITRLECLDLRQDDVVVVDGAGDLERAVQSRLGEGVGRLRVRAGEGE